MINISLLMWELSHLYWGSTNLVISNDVVTSIEIIWNLLQHIFVRWWYCQALLLRDLQGETEIQEALVLRGHKVTPDRWVKQDQQETPDPRYSLSLSLRILIWLKHFCLKNLIYTTFSILRHQSTCSTKRRPYVW